MYLPNGSLTCKNRGEALNTEACIYQLLEILPHYLQENLVVIDILRMYSTNFLPLYFNMVWCILIANIYQKITKLCTLGTEISYQN